MSIQIPKPTYQELLKISQDQELEIERLNKKEKQIANFEFYLSQSIDLVCIAGIDGFYKEINEAFIKTFGYTKSEILNKSFLDFVHPEDVEESIAIMEDLKLGNNSINFENRIIKKDGEHAIIQWTTSVDLSSNVVYAIGRDITQTRKIQNRLVTSERLLNAAQEIAKMGSWEMNLASQEFIWSDELYAIFETDKSLDLIKEFQKIYSEEETELFLDKIKQLQIDLKPFELEHLVSLPNNTKKWIHVIVVPILDVDGNFIAIRGNVQDITNKKQIRELLILKKQTEVAQKIKTVEEKSNIKFRRYIENALDGIFVADESGKFTETNPAATLTTGYSKEELLGMTVEDLTAEESIEYLRDCFTTLVKTGAVNGEFKTIHKSGDIRWRSVNAVKISDNRFMAFVKDITDIKQANDLLTNTFERITDAFVALDNNWCYTYMNKKAGEILNRNPDEMIGKHIWTEFPEGVDKSFYKAYHEAKNEQKYIYLQEYYEPYDLWFEKHIYPSNDGLSIFFRDITEDRIAKEKVENNEKRFRALVEYNDEIISIIDKNWNVVYRSLSAARITGWTNEERQNTLSADFIHPDFIEVLPQKINESIANPNIPIPVLLQLKHKKGNYIWLEGFLNNKLHDNSVQGIIANFRDVTASKKAQETLTNTFERITDAFVALDNNWCYTYMNKKAGEILNRNPDEMIGKHIWTEFPDAINGTFFNACQESINTQEYTQFEDYHELSQRWVENHVYPSEDGLSNFFRDITEEKIVKDKIKESEKKFRALVENNEGIITVIDEDLKVIYRSSSSARVTGYTDFEFDNIAGKDYYHPDYLEYVKEKIQNAVDTPNTAIALSFQVKHKSGNYIWLEGVLNNMLNDSSVNGIVANLRDVTERKTVIETLISERDKFAKIAATSPGLIYSMRQNKDGSLSYPYASDAVKDIYGLSFEEVEKDANTIFKLIHPEDVDEVIAKILKTKTTFVPLKGVYRYFHPTKGLVWHEVNSLPVREQEGTVICHGIITDITERIEAEQKIIKANRLYLFISQINQMIVRTTDEETLFKEACTIAVELGQFKMAWIGTIDNENQKVVPVMIAGEDNGYIDLLKTISIDKNIKGGNGPGGFAIRENKPVICNDIENDDLMAPWREEALSRGYKSLMVLPIRKFQKLVGLFCFYSGEKDFFDNQEIELLEEATDDVSFALEVFEKEIQSKKAEEAVYQSEKRYHTLTEVSPVGIFRTDASGYTTYVNPSWTQISGLPFQRALGNGWLDAVHEEDRKAILNGWENATVKNEKSLSEYRFVRPDGTIAWVMGQAIPEKNSDNEIVGYIGTITDITERKQGEEEFKKINKKLEGILDAIPDLLFEVGIDGHFYNFHSRHTNMLALPQSEFIGKKFSEVLPKEVAEISLLAVQEAANNGFSIGKQYSLVINGNLHWFELSIAPMQESDDNELHYICLSRDITEAKKGDFALQKSEERYRGLLNNLDAGIVVYGSDISIIMCNAKASELLSLPIEKILGKHSIDTYWKFLNEDSSIINRDTHPVNIIFNTRKPVKNFTLGINHIGSNDIVWVLVNGFPILDEQGYISEILISFIDITERKLMEIEIVEGRKQAESANKAKTDFLANMSHEIRTPLNGIIGFTDLLMKSNLEKNQLEYMNTISESATTLMHIVNDVLDFSKVESGKLELNIEDVNLFELIKQVIDLFKYQAIQKKIKLTYTLDNNVPEFVLADSIRLKQILVNLLSNALKFTNFGEITLDVSKTVTLKNDYLGIKFSVKDTGIGIKLDNNDKIFDSFVQEDNSTSRKFGGTGLGLAISNKLLALMDSKLYLHSKYGEGSDFNFEIKLKKITPKSENELAIENTPIDIKSVPSKILDNKKVLIVEDNKINMFLVKTLVKRLMTNCIIIEAKDGNEGVEMYIKEKPDVILMDIQMPNKNGYEATYEIRELEGAEKTPIIAVTAGILTGEKEKCFEAGMDDYLPKPIIIADLESTLLKWLDK